MGGLGGRLSREILSMPSPNFTLYEYKSPNFFVIESFIKLLTSRDCARAAQSTESFSVSPGPC